MTHLTSIKQASIILQLLVDTEQLDGHVMSDAGVVFMQCSFVTLFCKKGLLQGGTTQENQVNYACS